MTAENLVYVSGMDHALESLLSRVSGALHRLPGAVELTLFGSAADPTRADGYSVSIYTRKCTTDLHPHCASHLRPRCATFATG
jgi:hypothetical protein